MNKKTSSSLDPLFLDLIVVKKKATPLTKNIQRHIKGGATDDDIIITDTIGF